MKHCMEHYSSFAQGLWICSSPCIMIHIANNFKLLSNFRHLYAYKHTTKSFSDQWPVDPDRTVFKLIFFFFPFCLCLFCSLSGKISEGRNNCVAERVGYLFHYFHFYQLPFPGNSPFHLRGLIYCKQYQALLF